MLELYQKHKALGPTSARFLYYELVTQGLISKEKRERFDGKKGRRPDQNLIDALTMLRERGEIPWSAIVDETRDVEDYRGTDLSIRDWTISALDGYRLDPWNGNAPVILCESRSLAGVLRPVALRYRCLITSTNGQCNGFLRNDVKPIFEDGGDHRALIFGDLDLSGGHIAENTRRILGLPAESWELLAITEQQVKKFKLSRIRKFDKRDRKYHDAVETEALGQEVIMDLLRKRLEELLPEPLEDVQEREEDLRQRFREKLEKLEE